MLHFKRISVLKWVELVVLRPLFWLNGSKETTSGSQIYAQPPQAAAELEKIKTSRDGWLTDLSTIQQTPSP